MKKILLIIFLAVISVACSTTQRLEKGQVLYTGQKAVNLHHQPHTALGESTLEEVEAALAKAPNNALFGSSSVRIPLPIGLWIYNGFYNKKGIGKWIFNKFGSKPVLMADVSPDVRCKAATNILHDYGFLNGTVGYKIIPDKKDKKKAKVEYDVDFKNPYLIDSVAYKGFNERTEYLFNKSKENTLLFKGQQFNINSLNDERTRLSNMLRNAGCYYFRPDYLTYQADTTIVSNGHVYLRMLPVPEMPAAAEQPFYIGKVATTFFGRNGEMPNKRTVYKGMEIKYYNKIPVRKNMLYRWLDYDNYSRKKALKDSSGVSKYDTEEGMYSLHRQTRIQERLNSLGIFKYLEMHYSQRDTVASSDTLDLNIMLSMDKRYNAEFDANMKMKSNDQMGPAASFTVSRNNVFGGGETWNVALTAGYEWQMGGNHSSDMDSYRFGFSSSLIFPRVVFPKMGTKEYDFPATTTFKLYAQQQNRAKYYNMLAFGGNATYDFTPNKWSRHSVTPFRLTFNTLRKKTAEFMELERENPALYISLRNQFIPAMEYTYTYDNVHLKEKHQIWWQSTIASAGNLTSLLYKIGGHDFGKRQKKMLGVPYAQFLKFNSEFRYRYKMDRNNTIAARIAGGVVWSYGNMETAPYTEQFFVGGANSNRAFTTRSIGPGGLAPDMDKFAFINHVGDIRMEANLEYRFRIVNDLHGALFLDAGNVWLMKPDKNRKLGELKLKDFGRQIALGTGFGLRYDLDFLVLRVDLGVGIHAPYETEKKGYYNIPKFKDGLALNFAIGYPF